MAEPAEPTTRQDEVIKRAAAVLQVASDYQITGEYYARSLAAERLLADPAQTTELEELRTRVAAMSAINEDWQAYKRRKIDERRRLESERDLALWLHAEAAWRVAGFDVLTVELARRNHQLTAERDALHARIDTARAPCSNQPTQPPQSLCHCAGPAHVITCPDQRGAPGG